MCDLRCEMCNISIMDTLDNGTKHICDNNKIIDRIEKLEQRIRDEENKVDRLKSGILFFLSKYSGEILANDNDRVFPNNFIAIDMTDLEGLFKISGKCMMFERFDYLKSFEHCWDMLYSLYLETSELFREKPTRSYKRGTYEEKLEIVRGYCESVTKIFGFERDTNKNSTQVVQEIKDGK